MLICPDCMERLDESEQPACVSCGWQAEVKDGIPIFLSTSDRKDPTFRDYLDNYELIGAEDLGEGILDRHYVEFQATNLVDRIGNVEEVEACDIGIGKGHLTRLLLERGAARVTAIDICLAYLSRVKNRTGIRPILANAENLPFAEAFDVVVTTDVLEHVFNAGSFLFMLNRVVKAGGRAYIRVPYRESLLQYSPHLGCKYRFVHLRTFNKDLLGSYLAEAGFLVERFYFDGFSICTPQKFWQKTGRRSGIYARLQRLILDRVRQPAEVTRWPSWLARLLMRPMEITVVARKARSIGAD